ncbi:rod shape-determining protein MreD [Sporosarcina highlanderae]|uniref:Rod shape-determining protein MreD n=1 Tax=Sporosarcina highlanderae TaxID=3035916 RepID=A0ABT8JQT0_9BACL|nr:rod shape-determining protein MreD [Sporosarcina highlanderae]MDN4607138.1 rod shape-determining protein MreD [Sporosarcina highlanderae]
MIRFIIPLIAVVLFFLEPVFSLFSPVTIADSQYTLVPRFVIVYLIFIAVYYSRQRAIIYGIVLGLLYDMYHIDIIGVYTFLYPVICYLATLMIRQVHRHIFTVMFLSLIMIALLEILSYFFASLIALTAIGFEEFLVSRLSPTMIANSIFVSMFGYFFKQLIDKRGLEKTGL